MDRSEYEKRLAALLANHSITDDEFRAYMSVYDYYSKNSSDIDYYKKAIEEDPDKMFSGRNKMFEQAVLNAAGGIAVRSDLINMYGRQIYEAAQNNHLLVFPKSVNFKESKLSEKEIGLSAISTPAESLIEKYSVDNISSMVGKPEGYYLLIDYEPYDSKLESYAKEKFNLSNVSVPEVYKLKKDFIGFTTNIVNSKRNELFNKYKQVGDVYVRIDGGEMPEDAEGKLSEYTGSDLYERAISFVNEYKMNNPWASAKDVERSLYEHVGTDIGIKVYSNEQYDKLIDAFGGGMIAKLKQSDPEPKPELKRVVDDELLFAGKKPSNPEPKPELKKLINDELLIAKKKDAVPTEKDKGLKLLDSNMSDLRELDMLSGEA